jgi:GTP-binding protein Era
MQQELKKTDVDNLDYEAKNISSVLVMNKVDLVTNKRKLKSLQEELEDLGAFDKVFHVSCETGYGLDNLLSFLKSESMRRPWKHHPELKSTQSDQEKCEEILKGIIFNRFYEEIPYDTLAKMTAWVPFNNGEIKVNFDIEVKYEVQVAMMIGEKGRVLREIREELEKSLTKLYQMPVKCYLNVIKRRRGWSVETLNEHTSLAF